MYFVLNLRKNFDKFDTRFYKIVRKTWKNIKVAEILETASDDWYSELKKYKFY